MTTYQDKIVMMFGSHIHQGEIKAPLSASYPDLNISMALSPSVSPIFGNNPGYSIIDFNQNFTSTLVNWRFLQLYEYAVTQSVYLSMITVHPQILFNVRFSDPTSVRKFASRMQRNANLFGSYMATKMGYNWFFQMAAGLLYPLVKMFYEP